MDSFSSVDFLALKSQILQYWKKKLIKKLKLSYVCIVFLQRNYKFSLTLITPEGKRDLNSRDYIFTVIITYYIKCTGITITAGVIMCAMKY